MSSAASDQEKEEAAEKTIPEALAAVEAESAATFADLHERETAQTLTLVAILKQASPETYAHWGINE